MVQVRFAVHLAKVGRHEYVFIPKLRSICLLGSDVQRVSLERFVRTSALGTHLIMQDYNIASIRAITHRVVSPLKKVKRKADYGQEDSEQEDEPTEPPQRAMKRLALADGSKDDTKVNTSSKSQ